MNLSTRRLPGWLIALFAVLTAAAAGGVYVTAEAHGIFSSTLQRVLLPLFAALLLGALSCVTLRALRRPEERERPRWYFPALSGALTLAVTLVTYLFAGMWPVGDNTCIMIDMYSQYMPLLAYFRKALLGQGASLLYSTEMGLGISMIPTIGYYLASPLNLISVLFPQDYLAECFLTIIALKTVISAVTFACCVQYLTGKRSVISVLTALLYTTSMYYVAYSWNFMWFDVVMVLPLAVIALERLLRKGKFLFYTLLLGYALFANFYAAYMLCLFLGLYFFAWCIREKCGIRGFFGLALRFGICSVLGVLLACVLMLPTYLGLKVTSAAGETMPALKLNFSPLTLLSRHFFGVVPTELHVSDYPNIACGALSLLTLPLYVTTSRIPLRRRLCYLGLWAVLAASMMLNIPDRVWHGMHGPNGLPYRYAFLYVFVLLLMAADVLTHLDAIRPRQLVLCGAALIACVLLTLGAPSEDVPAYSVWITAGLILVYVGILALAAYQRLRVGAVCALLLFSVTAESLFFADETRGSLYGEGFSTKHSGYLVGDTHQLLGELGEEAESFGEAEGLLFFRCDASHRFTNMDGALYGYNGITIFDSTYYDATTQCLRHLGFGTNTVNSHRLLGYIPTLDALFGVRYYISPMELDSEPGLEQIDVKTSGSTTYRLYRSEDALSVGFMGTDALRDWTSSDDPVASQNTLYAALTGDSRPVLRTNTKALSTSGADTTVTYNTDCVSYSFAGGDTPGEVTLTITEPGHVYIYVDRNSDFDVSVDGALRQQDQDTFLNCGEMAAGDTLKVTITSDDRASGKIYAVTLDEDVYDDAIDTLKSGSLTLSAYSHTGLTGTVTAKEDGVFMTTVSYDAGWEAYVDGERVETYGVDDGLLALDLTAGTHTVELRFETVGLRQGAYLTLTGVAGLLLLLLLRRRFRFWTAKLPACAPFGAAYDVPDPPPAQEENPDTLQELEPGELPGEDALSGGEAALPEIPEIPEIPGTSDTEGEPNL
ncbi:MAG: YfhO family protein [Oscillospiraceae bacterium]|nr:YfhO family protein [Oscillospiraceae bacterium]